MSSIPVYDTEDWASMKRREEDTNLKKQMTNVLSPGREYLQPLPNDAVTEIQKLKYRVKWLEEVVNTIKTSPISMSEIKYRLQELEERVPKKNVAKAKAKGKGKVKVKKRLS